VFIPYSNNSLRSWEEAILVRSRNLHSLINTKGLKVYGREENEAEQIEQRKDVKLALKQSASLRERSRVRTGARDLLSLGTYALFLAGLAVVRYLLKLGLAHFPGSSQSLLERFVTAGMASSFQAQRC